MTPRPLALLLLTAAAALTGQAPATAHPHVWVGVEATVAYRDGHIVGITQRWKFDDMYSAMAIQGLDANGDGIFDRAELQALAKENVESIERFAYFTFAKQGETDLKFVMPTDYWLDYDKEVLTLTFTLPLEAPVASTTPGFSFSIYDPTYFIAFDLAKDEPVKLGEGAPAGCALAVDAAPVQGQEAQTLSEAFAAQLGGNAGGSFAKTVRVECARS